MEDLGGPTHAHLQWTLEAGKADRVGFQVKEDGTKVRIYKSTQTQIDA